MLDSAVTDENFYFDIKGIKGFFQLCIYKIISTIYYIISISQSYALIAFTPGRFVLQGNGGLDCSCMN